MKKTLKLLPLLSATTALAWQPVSPAEDSFLNHLTFSGRVGLNIDVKFGTPRRFTPDGDPYNYIDGYVLPNYSSDPVNYNPADPSRPITQYFGYDSYPEQINGANRTLSLTRSDSDLFTHSFEDDPHFGGEIAYSRELGTHGKASYGFELAVNYMNLCLNNYGRVSGPGTQFPYDLAADPGTYQVNGEYYGPSSLEGHDDPAAIYFGPPDGRPVTIHVLNDDKFEADIWGFRLGPYLQYPLGGKIDVHISGGLAAALIDARASWSEIVSIDDGGAHAPHTGSGSSSDVLWGFYVGGDFSWHLSKKWDLSAGAQYQDVGIYSQNVGTRRVELDMSKSIFVTFGVSYKF